MKALLVACAVTLCLTVDSGASAQAHPELARHASSLTARARTEGSVRIIATVPGRRGESAALRSRGTLESQARTLGGRFVRPIADLPLVAMSVDAQALERLVASGLITDVQEDALLAPHALPAWSIAFTHTDQVHRAEVTGIHANGVAARIAILDTGVDATHPDLEVVDEFCFSTTTTDVQSTCPSGFSYQEGPGAAAPCQGPAADFPGECGHGTEMAGIAAGTHGVAPDAEIVAVNVFSKTTCPGDVPCLRAQTSDLLNALAWTANYSLSESLAAINMSLGAGLYANDVDCEAASPTGWDLVNAIAEHTPVVASTGNEGYRDRVSWPGCIEGAITVACSSAQDAVGCNSGEALDLWAPGFLIDTIKVGGGTTISEGSSPAAAHISGTLALLRQLEPDIDAVSALNIMSATGVPITETPIGVTRPRIDVLAAAVVVSQGMVAPAASEHFGQAFATGDFNNDGYDDLAVSVEQDVGSTDRVGAVDVFYGSSQGLGIVRVWDQSRTSASQEAEDRFGEAIAVGNFNGDDYDDIAFGVPGEDVGTIVNAGTVYVAFGGPRGLTSVGHQTLWQDATNFLETCETGDELGFALAAGDFNQDGKDDLAMGAPYELIGSGADGGGVNVMYGSSTGLNETVLADKFLHQELGGFTGPAGPSDNFGYALAVGDFNQDGKDDLAVGAPGDVVANVSGAGSAQVIYGTASGLSAVLPVGTQRWTQDGAAIADDPETSDALGYALAAGDFNNDGKDDLAIGVPNEDFVGASNAGAFHVLYGSASGISATSSGFFYQTGPSMRGDSEASDKMGYSLAAADLNGDGYDDVACGVPGEDSYTGLVQVVHGSTSGVSASIVDDQTWTQESPNVPGTPEASDRFGYSVAVGDFNHDQRTDLAIGVPREALPSATEAGYVDVLFQASSGGLTGTGAIPLSE